MEQLGDIRFDIAISYAGEDRETASEIAKELHKKGYNVFYDRFPEQKAELWGKDLSSYLGEVFSKLSRYCLILLSSHYVQKPWPRFESKYALSRQLLQSEYILLLRLDDTILEGYPPAFGYIDYTGKVEDVIPLIEQKLSQENSLKEKTRLRSRLREFTREILYLEGVVWTMTLHSSSPDDAAVHNEPEEWGILQREYEEKVEEYSEKCKEYYDPLSWLKR